MLLFQLLAKIHSISSYYLSDVRNWWYARHSRSLLMFCDLTFGCSRQVVNDDIISFSNFSASLLFSAIKADIVLAALLEVLAQGDGN